MATSTAAVQLEMLTQGSVWKRNTGKLTGKEVKFLFLTNSTLNAKDQLKHPPQVIYVGDDGAIYNRELDDFLGLYDFYNVDSGLEARLEGLFVFNQDLIDDNEDEDDDGGNLDDVEIEGETEEDSEGENKEVTLAQLLAGESAERVQGGFTISNIPNYDRAPITEKQLSAAFCGYTQEPLLSHGLLVHRLVFKQNEIIDAEALDLAFAPNAELNTVESFVVKYRGAIRPVLWTTWLGVYPHLTADGNFLTVMVGTDDLPLVANDNAQANAEQIAGLLEGVDLNLGEDIADNGTIATTAAEGSLYVDHGRINPAYIMETTHDVQVDDPNLQDSVPVDIPVTVQVVNSQTPAQAFVAAVTQQVPAVVAAQVVAVTQTQQQPQSPPHTAL